VSGRFIPVHDLEPEYVIMSMRRFAFAVLFPAAAALSTNTAAAEPVIPSSATVAPAAQDTTFKAEGSYSLNVAVGGQAMAMTFVAEKKADGTLTGVFRHAEMGEFTTTSFKVEGRKLAISIETPGGTAMILMAVQPDNTVEGEWSMAGDGSKISGKKTS
jgi:hypothetical protein